MKPTRLFKAINSKHSLKFCFLFLVIILFTSNSTAIPKTNTKEVIKSGVKIKYYTKGEFYEYELYAKVDDKEYKIDVPECALLNIIEQTDFNLDGIDDILVEIGYGGNNKGLSYFFVTYDGNGLFHVTDEFGNEEVRENPKIENWNGIPSVSIIEVNAGMCIEEHHKYQKRYILEHGEAIRVEFKKIEELPAIKEVRHTDFSDDNNKIITMKYDINNDGIEEQFLVRYWERWSSVLFELIIKGTKYSCHLGCSRVGILPTTTNGYHDIVADLDRIYKWNGKTYACDNYELEIIGVR